MLIGVLIMPRRLTTTDSVLLIGLFGALGCGGGLSDALLAAEESPSVPEDLVVIYDDHDRTNGGDRVEVHGDGGLRGDRWRPGQLHGESRYWRGTVPEIPLRALVALLVEIEAWNQEAEEEPGRLDDQRATLTVRLGDDRTTIWEYASDLEARGRIFRVKTHLDALSFEVRHPMADGAADGFGGDRER
jgi:hypothetical protein